MPEWSQWLVKYEESKLMDKVDCMCDVCMLGGDQVPVPALHARRCEVAQKTQGWMHSAETPLFRHQHIAQG